MCLIQFFARVVINYSAFLACDDNGLTWLYTHILGSIFITFHMMCICMQAVMIMKVHYIIPRKLGYYDAGGQKESDETELINEKTALLAKQNEDDFKRAD